jgi:nucleotide-binding universal stress UspA family protein
MAEMRRFNSLLTAEAILLINALCQSVFVAHQIKDLLIIKPVMKTIITLTDFSENSLNAVKYAADMARFIRARLVIMHVVLLPVSSGEAPVPAFNMEYLENEAVTQINNLKEKLLERTNEKIIIHTEVKLGNVLPQLKQYADLVKPYAIVMGEESAGSFERLFLGGTAVTAIKNVYWPLILVPFNVHFDDIKKVGLACDLDDVQETIHADTIKRFISDFNAELHVMHVTEGDKTFDSKTVAESMILQEMLGEMHPQYHFLKEEDVDTAIQKFVVQNDLDMLIVVPKKHLLISKILKPRHTKRLVLEAEVPIMSIHA